MASGKDAISTAADAMKNFTSRGKVKDKGSGQTKTGADIIKQAAKGAKASKRKSASKTSSAKKGKSHATMKDAMPDTYGDQGPSKKRGIMSRLGDAWRNRDAEKGRRDFGIEHD